MIVENFLELVDIDDVIFTEEYINMVDITVDDDNSFFLKSGIISHNSAGESARTYRDPNTDGIFKLKGKFMNTSKMTDKKILQDEKGRLTEASNLLNTLGLELNKKLCVEDLRFGEILISTDMDCLEENTNIVTKDGIKKIKDITPSDLILTHKNEYKSVIRMSESIKNENIEINVNGNTFICSENHKLIVVRKGEVIEIEAKNLKYSDFCLIKND